MKALLLFPPQAQPFLPHPALPQLAAVLRREGVDVVVRDLNLELYEHYLSAPVLDGLGMDPARVARVQEARRHLRCGDDMFDLADYYSGVRAIREALRLVSSRYEGLDWDLKRYELSAYSTSSWASIHEATLDRRANLLIGWFESIMPSLAREAPDLVGISVAWDDQLIPAFTLARQVKMCLPDVHVCMGGSMIGHLAGALGRQEQRKIFSLVDSFVPFEGDPALPRLIQALSGRRLGDVPGLIYADRKKVVSNPPEPPPDLSSLPVPDFGDLGLERYYSPRVYLPVSASRGCYWARCAFCSHHFSGSRFRQRPFPDVLAEMDELHRRHGCRDFYFSDDSLPPALGRKLAGAIADSGRPYRWAAELRCEEGMDESFFNDLFAGGARLLLFGLESHSQRILDLMRKGVQKETAARVISAASRAGIITWVFFFVGFPGETEAEARETLDFLIERRHDIDMVAGGPYILARNSAVFDHPDQFGIEPRPSPGLDLQLACRYVRTAGRPEEAHDTAALLSEFRTRREGLKFLRSFVAEPHLLFFPKSHFQETLL